MVADALHINQKLQHDKAGYGFAHMLVEAHNVVLADNLLVLLDLSTEAHRILRNDLVVLFQCFQSAATGPQHHFAKLGQLLLCFSRKMHIVLEHAACFFGQCFAVVTNTLNIVNGMQKTCVTNGQAGVQLGGAHFRQVIGYFSLEGVHHGLML